MSLFPSVDDQLKTLLRGAVDVLDRRELVELLRARRPLRVKLGVDPSSPDLHLGHTVQMRRLRAFQDAGHHAVLIIGDYTAMVGDPSGKNKTRPQLTHEEVERNAQTYLDQAGKVLDLSRLEIRRNGEWFAGMSFMDVLRLCARATVSQMLEREDFHARFDKEQPISLHEFVYPLMQGWDSVMIKADIELGGTDQLFNLLMGRRLQEQQGQKPQVCITGPIIPGLDGDQKMSKSLGNAIGLRDEPNDMFGKVMSIPDRLMPQWFTQLTREPEDRLAALLDPARTHPREAKLALAHLITAELHGPAAAASAREHFVGTFSRGELPADIPDRTVTLAGGGMAAHALVRDAHGVSGTEARRLIQQGGARLIQPDTGDEFVLKDANATLTSPDLQGRVLKVGKRHFYRLVIA
ncbi:MAG: tyrosine--tRNA ligase [Planctomycetes bacterium]|jgi:tyrosyl-tRNA synthetase|nr:tyrosine--tRNA ligase [Planctomycetota bacterium]MCL4731156.1 tyrosine--tRNA ligase [Planctomycetota bacterium]